MSPSVRMSTLEKLSDADFFIRLLTCFLLLDLYLLIRYSRGVAGLDYAWLVETLSLGDALLFLILYSFFVALGIPILKAAYAVPIWIVLFLADAWREKTGLVQEEAALRACVRDNNTALHREVERLRDAGQGGQKTSMLCFGLVVLILAQVLASHYDDRILAALLASELQELPQGLRNLVLIGFGIPFLGICISGLAVSIGDPGELRVHDPELIRMIRERSKKSWEQRRSVNEDRD